MTPTNQRAISAIRLLIACAALSTTGAATWAMPLSKKDFAPLASKRDREMGEVLVETDKAVIFSPDVSKTSNACNPRTVMAPAADAQAQYEKEKAAFDAALAEHKKKGDAWRAAYARIEPEYNERLRELRAEVKEWERRVRPQTGDQQKSIFDYEREKAAALRQRYIAPLGPAPQFDPQIREPQQPAGTQVAGYAVNLEVLFLNKGLYEPLIASDTEARLLQQSYLPVIQRLCSTVNMIAINYGFYDILINKGSDRAPSIPVLQILTKKGKGWQVTQEDIPSPLGLKMSRSSLLMAHQTKEGELLWKFFSERELMWYWLPRDEDIDFAFGNVFDHKAPHAAKPAGLVHKNRQYWSQYTASDSSYETEAFLLQYAKIVLSGRFDVAPNTVHEVSTMRFIFHYGGQCRPNRFDTEWLRISITETTKHRNLHTQWETSETYGGGYVPQRFADVYQSYRLLPTYSTTRDAVEKNEEFLRKFFEKEGCESPVTQQLLENFARLARNQPSLQGISLKKRTQ